MYNVSFQVNAGTMRWDDAKKRFKTFQKWEDVAVLAYRLARRTRREVRVERMGQGHYFHPSHADHYLTQKKSA